MHDLLQEQQVSKQDAMLHSVERLLFSATATEVLENVDGRRRSTPIKKKILKSCIFFTIIMNRINETRVEQGRSMKLTSGG